MNAAVITARAGSKRLADKHTRRIHKRYLIEYPLIAAARAARVDRVFLATDSGRLMDIGDTHGAEPLRLPPELTTDTATQAQALDWAVRRIYTEYGADIYTALLGNTVMIHSAAIDESLTVLADRPEVDSVMTVWQAEDDHPYRALVLDDQGYLTNLLPDSPDSSNVQRYPTVYYHDQGLWTFRKETLFARQGPPPWTWVGRRCVPIVRPWWAGRDIDVPFDLDIARYWVNRYGAEQ